MAQTDQTTRYIEIVDGISGSQHGTRDCGRLLVMVSLLHRAGAPLQQRSVRVSFALAVVTLLAWNPSSTAREGPSWLRMVNEKFYARVYDVSSGLPVNGASSLALGADGSLWLGTYDGLVRFDGQEFHVFRHSEEPGLPSNRIDYLYSAPDGPLWVVTETHDVARFEAGVFRPYRVGTEIEAEVDGLTFVAGKTIAIMDGIVHTLEDLEWQPVDLSTLGSPVRSVHPHGEDGGWLLTESGSVWLWRPGDLPKPLALPEHTPAQGWTAAIPDSQTGWWLASRRGLFHLTAAGLQQYPVPVREDPTDLFALGYSRNKEVLAFAPGSLFSLRNGSLESIFGDVRIDNNPTYLHERLSRLGDWVNSRQRVSWRDQPVAQFHESDVTDFLPISSEEAWAATGKGVVRITARPLDVVDERDGLTQPNTYPVAFRGGSLYVGTWGSGLAEVAPAGTTLHDLQSQNRERPHVANFVSALHVDPNRRLWVGAGNHVCQWTGSGCEPFDQGPGATYRDSIRLIHTDSRNRLWIGNERELRMRMNTASLPEWKSWTVVGDRPVQWCRAVLELPADTLLFATSGAGVLMNPHRNAQWIDRESGLTSNRIRSLMLDPEHGVWVTTEDAGLCLLRVHDDTPTVVGCASREDGLLDDVVHTIRRDDSGRYWLSGNRGLSWVDGKQLVARVEGRHEGNLMPYVFDEDDGLRSAEFNGGAWPPSAIDGEGRMYFPSQRGVVVADPRLLARPKPPPVHLIRATIEGREDGRIPYPTQDLKLATEETTIEFEWMAVELNHGSEVHYRYRLVGVDEGWQGPTKDRRVRYERLPAGDRVFEVQAGIGGQWGDSIAAVRLDRPPFFTESAFFPISIALIVMLFGGIAWVLRSRTMVKRQAELESVVQHRTVELATRNQQLASSNHLLAEQTTELSRSKSRIEALDALRQRYVGNMSHELRTPLTLVKGVLEELAAKGDSLDGSQKNVEIAQRNTDRLEEMVNRLLDAARLDRDRATFTVRRFDLAATTRRVCERFVAAAEAADINFTVETHPESLPGFSSLEALDTILTNLVGNALKYARSGEWISVEIRQSDTDEFARLCVRDGGIGIGPDDLPRVFDRYFRAKSAGEKRPSGAGIGLAHTKELTEGLGGTISVTSAVGHGSEFTVLLPLGVDHVAPEDIAALASDPTVADDGSLRPPTAPMEVDPQLPTVLIVEDHPDLRDYLAAHFNETFNVLTAVDGRDGVDVARLGQPDLIVTDIMMPRLDGVDMIRELRSEEVFQSTPVLILSAKHAPRTRLEGLELADDYMTKPFQMSEVLLRARNLLRRAPKTTEEVTESPNRLEPPAPEPISQAPQTVSERSYVERLNSVIDAHISMPGFGVESLARKMGQSRRQLLRDIRRITELGASEYLRERRLSTAQLLLREGEVTRVAEAAAEVGMTPSYFTRAYVAWCGTPPSQDLQKS